MSAPQPDTHEDGLVVRVLPDVSGLDKKFDYLVPEVDIGRVGVGTEVRVSLHGRRVGGWIVEVGVEPPDGVRLHHLAVVRGVGPASEMIDLAEWAAWRWAGRTAQFLRTASPPTALRAVPSLRRDPPVATVVPAAPGQGLVEDAVAGGVSVVRLAPGVDRFGFVVTAISRARLERFTAGNGEAPSPSVLVVCPSIDAARRLTVRLRRTGLTVALLADDRKNRAVTEQWALAAAGGTVIVGARSAAWAPAPNLALAIVVDEHDEAHQSQQTPSWHVRDLLVERCRRAGAPLVLLSPCPTIEGLRLGTLQVQSRSEERKGWPPIEVIDRRNEDPTTASSLFSGRLTSLLRVDGRVICVLNRTGRARLLACRGCDELARCEVCGAAVRHDDESTLACQRCGATRPVVCASCGSTAFRVLRMGVSRARDELEALLGEHVVEVAGSARAASDSQEAAELDRARVLIGTEAVLHRVGQAAVVAFLDFDQELTAPRFRASEQALAMVARAARLAGPRDRAHRVVLQTRLPDHPVVQSALHADPSRLVDAERPVREALRFPPFAALAQISGQAGSTFVEQLRRFETVEVLGENDGPWLIRSSSHQEMCDALAATPRPQGRLRVEVDPARV